MKIVICLENIIKHLLIAAIVVIRPILGCPGCCRYALSCTDYAIFMLETERLIPALNAIIRRVLSCHPFSRNNV